MEVESVSYVRVYTLQFTSDEAAMCGLAFSIEYSFLSNSFCFESAIQRDMIAHFIKGLTLLLVHIYLNFSIQIREKTHPAFLRWETLMEDAMLRSHETTSLNHK